MPVGDGFDAFDFDPSTNTVATGSFTRSTDVGVDGTAPLFTLNFDLGSANPYEIGVDFQNVNRGFLVIDDEFYSPPSPTDFTFTLTRAVSIPEPSTLTVLAPAVAVISYRRRLSPTLRE